MPATCTGSCTTGLRLQARGLGATSLALGRRDSVSQGRQELALQRRGRDVRSKGDRPTIGQFSSVPHLNDPGLYACIYVFMYARMCVCV